MPARLPWSFVAFKIFAMAVLRFSCIFPSRIGHPMLLPKSKGPMRRTSMPGTWAISSTCAGIFLCQLGLSVFYPVNAMKWKPFSFAGVCAFLEARVQTFSSASCVSIWTIVTNPSFACCKYAVLSLRPKRSWVNGLPNPRWPIGGNLAVLTSLRPSSAVLSRGTMIPWAPLSRAPLPIVRRAYS